jgi:hypothetical protein
MPSLAHWRKYINLFITHSPITDTVRNYWQLHVKNTITLASRGYNAEGAHLQIDESISASIKLMSHLQSLTSNIPINLCLPHSGLHSWRFMIEHPAVASFVYVEEGTASTLCTNNSPCLPALSPNGLDDAGLISNLGYDIQSANYLFQQETHFFECAHRKYSGAIALFESAFHNFPRRVQLPTPNLVPSPPNVAIILFPYLTSFPDSSGILRWLRNCRSRMQSLKIGLVVLSPHPSNIAQSSVVLNLARMVFQNNLCLLIADFKRLSGIPSWTETGLLAVSCFVSPIQNSTFFYAACSKNPATRLLVDFAEPTQAS